MTIERRILDQNLNVLSDDPLFLRGAREERPRAGISADAILAEDRRAAESPDYPSDECFYPEEAERYLSLKIMVGDSDSARQKLDESVGREYEDRSAHLAGCIFCQTMLESMQPMHARREAFLEAVRQEAPFQMPQPELHGALERCRAYGRIIWPLGLPVVGAVSLLIAAFFLPKNSIPGAAVSNALSSASLVMLIMVIAGVAIICMLFRRPRIVLAQGQLVSIFSFAVGIPAVLGILAAAAYEWREVSASYAASQTALVGTLQNSYKLSLEGKAFPAITDQEHGVLINTKLLRKDYAVYMATSRDLPGSLVAVAKRDGGEIKWAVGESQRTMLDVKFGTIKKAGDDRFQLISESGEIIDGRPDHTQLPLVDGAYGLAVMPDGKNTVTVLRPLKGSTPK